MGQLTALFQIEELRNDYELSANLTYAFHCICYESQQLTSRFLAYLRIERVEILLEKYISENGVNMELVRGIQAASNFPYRTRVPDYKVASMDHFVVLLPFLRGGRVVFFRVIFNGKDIALQDDIPNQ